MKVSEPWLRTLVDPPLGIEALALQLTNAGIEVDGLEVALDTPKVQMMILKVPPNRGDCLSMVGIAREIAALNGIACYVEEITRPKQSIADKAGSGKGPAVGSNETLTIETQANDACPRYLGRIIRNINPAAKTPEWMRERLEHAGIRSLSPVVDVTNYVMLELGQPMHAFDLGQIEGGIQVRFAKLKESLLTLDEKLITLDEQSLVIADKKKALALAGIIGGKSSAVSHNTQNIFLESAYFNPVNIRLTAARYGLRTEASYRFERGLDPELPRLALERATKLLLDIVGGEAQSIQDMTHTNSLPKMQKIHLRLARIKQILGIALERSKIETLLKRLNMRVESEADGFAVESPSFRPDIQLEIDLIEEIARLYGYEKIPAEIPSVALSSTTMMQETSSLLPYKSLLKSRGYDEMITYSFIDPKLQVLFDPEATEIPLANPISSEMAMMRSSLWPGLVERLKYNLHRGQERLRIFETGLCFKRQAKSQALVQETYIAGMISGSIHPPQWGEKSRVVDFFDLKADVEALLNLHLNAEKPLYIPNSHPALLPAESAEIGRGDQQVGWIGALDPRILQALDITGPILAFELRIPAIDKGHIPKFQPISKFPAIRRDLALLIPKAQPYGEMLKAIENLKDPLLQEIFIFDIYQGKGIPTGSKSVALGLILQHPSRTLIEVEVNAVVERVVKVLQDQFQASLRE